MSLLESLILGIIQGATEFLPVSSSGHLVMGQALMDIQLPGVAFEIAVHVATLLSVLLVYRKRVQTLLAGLLKGEREAWGYGGLLVLATIPAALVGLGLGDLIEGLFDSPVVAGVALLITGSFLWTTKWALQRSPTAKPGVLVAILMGVAQAFAIIPGISRSGATGVAGLWMGMDAEEAAAFSFLMAIPAILGAAVLEAPELMEVGVNMGGAVLTLGALAAAVTGILAIRTFLMMLKHQSFHRFGPYCWAVGGLFLLYLTLGG